MVDCIIGTKTININEEKILSIKVKVQLFQYDFVPVQDYIQGFPAVAKR